MLLLKGFSSDVKYLGGQPAHYENSKLNTKVALKEIFFIFTLKKPEIYSHTYIIGVFLGYSKLQMGYRYYPVTDSLRTAVINSIQT